MGYARQFMWRPPTGKGGGRCGGWAAGPSRRGVAAAIVGTAAFLVACGAVGGGAVPTGRMDGTGEAAAAAPPGRPLEPPADLLLRGGQVYTMDAARSWADAVAVVDGRVAWAGADADAPRWAGPATEVVDLEGRLVLPGFHDVHVHPISGGLELGECDLNALTTPAELLREVERCAAAGEGWVRGGGWQLPLFPASGPRKEALDGVVPDRPVFLGAADGHSAWVNSRALEVAGIDASTPDPAGGRIERDPATGEPTGTLRESAVGLVSRHLPPHTVDDRVAGLERALEMAGRFGITTWEEANGGPDDLEAYARLDRDGRLTVRTSVAMRLEPTAPATEVPRLVDQRERFRGARLRADGAKIYVDGVIESGTAALLQPYAGSDRRGEANVTAAQLADAVVALDGAGLRVHLHTIGDRAIRMALDALEAARRVNGADDSRHILSHVQLFDPADIPRLRRLRAAAAFQPLWAYADTYITDLTEPVLGPERSRWLYPMGSVAASGALLACGSDWSVSSMNPLLAIEVGITRADPDRADDPAWIPGERVDLETMLACTTIGAARALGREEETGSLEPGKAADLTLLDRDLFLLPPREIGDARVVLTVVGGRVVFRDEGS